MAELPKASLEQGRGSVTAVELTDAHGRRRTINVAELNEADLALAEQFGYHPVFKRKFGWLSTFSFAVSISGLYSTVLTTFYYPLLAGGPASIVWCWFVAGIGCMTIAMSVAELTSAYPTAGGLYFTVSRLAPPKWSPVISWFTGWLNLIGQIAGVASSEYGCAQLLLAAVSLSTDVTYVPTTGHTIAVMAGLTLICGLINSMNTAYLEKLTKTYVIFHVAVLVACVVSLLVLTPTKNSASYVFTYVENNSGWNPIGWSFLFGFLSVQWTMTDYDATAHITEEIEDPAVKAPWSIFLAMLFTWLAGWLFNIVLAFCMPDPLTLLDSEVAQPVITLFDMGMGRKGAIAFAVFAVIIIQFVCWSAMQALARTVFAFSRDRLLPFSSVWAQVNSTTSTPLYAVWICTVLCIAINLVGLGSYAAISGVFNITAIALDVSYCIPIACKLIWNKFEPGPWHLGKFSFLINLWAILWTAFATIIFLMPISLPTTAETFNWAIAFLAGILAIAAVWWLIRGRHVYTGPIAQADMGGPAVQQAAAENEKHQRVSDSDSQDRKKD